MSEITALSFVKYVAGRGSGCGTQNDSANAKSNGVLDDSLPNSQMKKLCADAAAKGGVAASLLLPGASPEQRAEARTLEWEFYFIIKRSVDSKESCKAVNQEDWSGTMPCDRSGIERWHLLLPTRSTNNPRGINDQSPRLSTMGDSQSRGRFNSYRRLYDVTVADSGVRLAV